MSDWSNERDEIFAAGRLAGRTHGHEAVGNCPHKDHGSWQFQAWMSGWSCGLAERAARNSYIGNFKP